MSLLRQALDAIHDGGRTIMVMMIASEIVAEWSINRTPATKDCPRLAEQLKAHGLGPTDIEEYWAPALLVAQLAANVTDFKYPRKGEVNYDG